MENQENDNTELYLNMELIKPFMPMVQAMRMAFSITYAWNHL